MTTELILHSLLRANLVASVAIGLTLLLRPLMSRVFGARATYRLWLLVPLATMASLIPAASITWPATGQAEVLTSVQWLGAHASLATRSVVGRADAWMASSRLATPGQIEPSALLVGGWLLVALVLFGHAVHLSRRALADATLGPALIGVLRPRLVLPVDFATRFDAREQELVLAHEAVHQAGGHARVNALVELARCLNWMNPLVHVAARCVRTDQELSCDAAVIARYPDQRRAYGQALLKTQIADAVVPLGCAWPGRSAAALRRRILMLSQRGPGRVRAAAGAALITALIGGGSLCAWSAQSPILEAPASAAATPPPGLLTQLEARVHLIFLKVAHRGDVKVLFLGDSAMDFWRYEWGGRSAWDSHLASLKAANFGVEGAHTKSVLWRLQHGELDGYQARVVVLSPLGVADMANHGAALTEIIAGDAAVIAEIRKRQPQAKILLVCVPRGYPPQVEAFVDSLDDAVVKLADDRNVFYLDLRPRLVGVEGLYAQGHGASLGPKGYALWATNLTPKLTELMR